MRLTAELDPALARLLESLDAADVERCIWTLIALESWRCRHVGLLSRVHGILRTGKPTDVGSPDDFERASLDFDNRYMELEELGRPEAEWITLFRAARVAYSVAVALRGVSHHTADEILYELAHANRSPSDWATRARRECHRVLMGR